jgi:hypothetical protein
MWSKMDADLADITKISQPNWTAPSPGCQEARSDFGWLSVQEFLRYHMGILNIPTCDAQWGKNEWGIIVMGFGRRGFSGMYLLIFPAECRVGVKLSHKKAGSVVRR